jgi:hypothetical protein
MQTQPKSILLDFIHTIGQEVHKTSVANGISEGVFPQGLLVHGIPGVGQHSFVCDLAAILLCESHERKPCGKCISCLERIHQSRDSILPIFPQEESQQKKEETRKMENQRRWDALLEEPYGIQKSSKEHISIAQIRDLKERLSYAESAGRKRVVILFWPESMMEAAANALLKILEEPPKDTYFLLSCENKRGVLSTILSRCVQLGLPNLSYTHMETFLTSRQKQKLSTWIPVVQGSPGKLLGLERVGCEQTVQSVGKCISYLLALDLKSEGYTDRVDQWMVFSDWLEEQWFVEDVDSVEWVCTTLLEVVRLLQQERITEEEQRLLDTSVFNDASDLERPLTLEQTENLVRFANRVLVAIKQYVRPSTAILSSYLEAEQEWVKFYKQLGNGIL